MLSTPLEFLLEQGTQLQFEALRARFSGLPREELLRHLYDSLITCGEWKQIVDHSPDGIFLAGPDGRGIYANQAYKRISGLSQEEIEDVPPEEFLASRYIDRSCIMLVKEQKQAVTIESYFYRTGRQCLVTCKPILDQEGKISVMIGIIRDMTEINGLREERNSDKALIARYKDQVASLKKQLFCGEELVVEDPAMLELLRAAQKIAQVDSPVMITGETGVGKEEVAKYIHGSSPRCENPFIKINCSTIPEGLFESELFGYEGGAFTGAKREGKPGLFEAADKGTIFLDEIGELPLAMQAKLLRVIQEKEIIRVGGTHPVKVDVRILSATNRDLRQMVDEKAFRIDLYYRLNVVPIRIPPLRERPGDLMPLAEHFRVEMNRKYGYRKTFSREALQMIQEYSWPGNIRELRNVLERAIIIGEGDEIGRPELESLQPDLAGRGRVAAAVPLEERVKRFEYGCMKSAYRQYGNLKDAAASVGMKKSTFAGKFKQYRQQFGEIKEQSEDRF